MKIRAPHESAEEPAPGLPQPDDRRASVTQLLQAWQSGDEQATETVLSIVYAELKRQALGYLRRERPDHTLQATALVHEAFIRLLAQRRVEWQSRAHFLGTAGQMMRRILVDYARERHAAKRPPAAGRLELGDDLALAMPPEVEVLMLDAALQRLAVIRPRQADIVELKYFGGFSEEDVATALSLSRATVTREWQAARAWLYREMTGGAGNDPN